MIVEKTNMAHGTVDMAAMISVKIDKEVYRLVKTVASWKELTVADYLAQIVRPIVEKDMAKLVNEAKRPHKEE
jgi:hypothetical protein